MCSARCNEMFTRWVCATGLSYVLDRERSAVDDAAVNPCWKKYFHSYHAVSKVLDEGHIFFMICQNYYYFFIIIILWIRRARWTCGRPTAWATCSRARLPRPCAPWSRIRWWVLIGYGSYERVYRSYWLISGSCGVTVGSKGIRYFRFSLLMEEMEGLIKLNTLWTFWFAAA